MSLVPKFICKDCGIQFPESNEPPTSCPISDDERAGYWVKGQNLSSRPVREWTTLEEMRSRGYRNEIRAEENGLSSIITRPDFAIGQRAFIVQTPDGNLLWDCIAYLDEDTTSRIKAIGGLKAIAVSHPQYYSGIVEWSDRFGEIPIYLHAADKKWVVYPSPNIKLWEGETLDLFGELKLIKLGGHFDGGTVLYWPQGALGRGVVLSADIIQVVDSSWVSFMYSYPTLIPLPAMTVQRIANTMEEYRYDRIYGGFEGRNLMTNARECVRKSAERYVKHLTEI
jgi:glyoxylase-like metal-dependent hydrolase (beta-lactamase superfamily II)